MHFMFMAAAAATLFVPLNILEEFRQKEKQWQKL